MKRLHVAAGLLAAVVCLSARAQTTIMRADIPFDFQLGQTLMPAGKYVVQFSASPRTVILQEQKKGGHSAIVLTTPAVLPSAPKEGLLEFNRYGDEYFFSKIWTPFSPEGGEIVKTSRERELAHSSPRVQTTEVALRTK
jgi:hypothetical protein